RPKHPKRNILVQLSGDLARRENSRRIAVHQYFHQHRRVKGLVTPTIPFIAGIKDLQVQPIDDFDHKIRQVILWQPFRRRRRQQKILHGLVRKEGSWHHLDLSKKTSLAYTRFRRTCKKFSAAQTPSPSFS